MKPFTLYGLKRSDQSIIRYIGITCQKLKSRLARHVRGNDKNPKRDRWIAKTFREGAKVEIIPYAINLDFQSALVLEVEVIFELRKDGFDLLNISNGGHSGMEGRHHTPEHREYMSKIMAGREFSSETKTKMSAWQRGRKLPEGTKNKLSLAGRQKRAGASSKFLGVNWMKTRKKWRAEFIIEKKNFHLGVYENETDAAIAHDWVSVLYYGDQAKLNFPNQ